MKKGAFALLVFVMIVVLLSSCAASFPKKERIVTLSGGAATEALKGKTEKEIADHWGKPDGILSGFYGDIYEYNGKRIILYYDADSRVTDVLVSDIQ